MALKSEKTHFAGTVFDLDGTLFDLPVRWKSVRTDLARITGTPMKRVSIFRVLALSDPGLRRRLFDSIDSFELPAAEEADPIDGSPELVNMVSKKVRVGLVTMQGRRACHRVLDRFNLRDAFAVIVTREDSLERSKQLTMACESMKVLPKDTLFCGDKLSDLLAGKKVGIVTAIVGRKPMGDHEPDYRLGDVGGLRDVLSTVFG